MLYPAMKPRMGWLAPYFMAASIAWAAQPKRIVILAGSSQGRPYGEHEHLADAKLMAQCLGGTRGLTVDVYGGGWPERSEQLNGADAIIVFAEGAEKQPLFLADHETVIRKLMAKGVGLGLVHWSIEAPVGKEPALLDWAGGAFELNYSVNPHWRANFTSLPDHPVTRGVHPFSTLDEWTFHQRFRAGGVTPILVAVPPASALTRPDGPRSGNAQVRDAVAKRVPQTLMWVSERADGGRGFGFAGGHFHAHWADDNERKLLLNAMVWVAGMDVPAGGVASRVTAQEMAENLSGKRPSLPRRTREIVFLAGAPSHPRLMHEYRAGSMLLAKCLQGVDGVHATVVTQGWPQDTSVLERADAIVVYADGADRDPLLQGDRLDLLGKLMRRGVGLGLLHWSVEASVEKGEPEFIDWIGGAFEVNWSVNPNWDAEFTSIPEHEVTRGVHPFGFYDEWYYHLRFRDHQAGITPILTAIAPASSLKPKDGLRAGNPAVRADVAAHVPQVLMWVTERPDGGRGFGFTGGHSIFSWENNDQRTLILNSILWIARLPVPPGGVVSSITEEDALSNLAGQPFPDVKRPGTPGHDFWVPVVSIHLLPQPTTPASWRSAAPVPAMAGDPAEFCAVITRRGHTDNSIPKTYAYRPDGDHVVLAELH